MWLVVSFHNLFLVPQTSVLWNRTGPVPVCRVLLVWRLCGTAYCCGCISRYCILRNAIRSARNMRYEIHYSPSFNYFNCIVFCLLFCIVLCLGLSRTGSETDLTGHLNGRDLLEKRKPSFACSKSNHDSSIAQNRVELCLWSFCTGLHL